MGSTGLLLCPFLNGKCEAWPPEGMRGGGERTLLTSPADRKPAPRESRGSRFPLPAPSSSCRLVGVGIAGQGLDGVLGISGPPRRGRSSRPPGHTGPLLFPPSSDPGPALPACRWEGLEPSLQCPWPKALEGRMSLVLSGLIGLVTGKLSAPFLALRSGTERDRHKSAGALAGCKPPEGSRGSAETCLRFPLVSQISLVF